MSPRVVSQRSRRRAKSSQEGGPRPKRARSLRPKEIAALRGELKRRAAAFEPVRLNADPEDVQRSVGKLVLTLVEFIHRLLERQAIRRMEEKTLTPAEIESVGEALMRLDLTIRRTARQFGLRPEDLNLDLGPIGRLM